MLLPFFFRKNMSQVCFLVRKWLFGKVHKFAYNAERQGSTGVQPCRWGSLIICMMVPRKSFQKRTVTQLAVTPLGPTTCCCQWPWLPYKTPNLGVTPGGYIQSSHTSRLWSHGVSDVWQPAAFWQMLIFWSGNPPEYWLPSKPMEATTNCDYDILVARSRMPKEFLRHWQFERHPNATKFVHLPNKAGTFATTIVKLGHL